MLDGEQILAWLEVLKHLRSGAGDSDDLARRYAAQHELLVDVLIKHLSDAPTAAPPTPAPVE